MSIDNVKPRMSIKPPELRSVANAFDLKTSISKSCEKSKITRVKKHINSKGGKNVKNFEVTYFAEKTQGNQVRKITPSAYIV